jgi:hypothetical protein
VLEANLALDVEINGPLSKRAVLGTRRWNTSQPAPSASPTSRRDMTKGQKAMALALIEWDAEENQEKRGRGKRDDAGRKRAESALFSYRRLKEARMVLQLAVKCDARGKF